MPLSNFVPRGFGFVHHSIANLYHEVPNLSITIRNFFIAVGDGVVPRAVGGGARLRRGQRLRRARVTHTGGRGGAVGQSGGREHSHGRHGCVYRACMTHPVNKSLDFYIKIHGHEIIIEVHIVGFDLVNSQPNILMKG